VSSAEPLTTPRKIEGPNLERPAMLQWS
jgi:hypothetical protein